jgi:hypothetical protein
MQLLVLQELASNTEHGCADSSAGQLMKLLVAVSEHPCCLQGALLSIDIEAQACSTVTCTRLLSITCQCCTLCLQDLSFNLAAIAKKTCSYSGSLMHKQSLRAICQAVMNLLLHLVCLQDLSIDLAAIAKEKVQLQREFDAYKDLCAQTARQHREEQARLLEENASLKARIAAEAARVAMGGSADSHTVDAVPAGLRAPRVRGKTFAAVPDAGLGGMVEQWLSRLEGCVAVVVCFTLSSKGICTPC